MGTQSKRKPRQLNFSDAIKTLSEMMDQKFIQNTQHFTQSLASMRVRLEALEDVIMEKLGETEESLKERVLERVARMQGFQEVSTPVQKGSVVRLKIKEEEVGKETPTTPWQDAFMVVGHNQINTAIDTDIVGTKLGETKTLTLPDPENANVQRRITYFVAKVFQGDESSNETQETTQTEAVKEAQRQ